MKLIIAYIPPEQLEPLINALVAGHVHGMSVGDARGFGQEHDLAHPDYREFMGLEMTRKTRIEIACQDGEVEKVLAAFYDFAHTGQRGDGKVFVLPLLDVLRLKTGERGEAAIGPFCA